MIPLFDSNLFPRSQEQLEQGAVLLRGFAAAVAPVLVDEVARIAQTAPFRHMVTPGGYTMSVAMTNCGRLGWVSDRTGYRYTSVDPNTGAPWPAMPRVFIDIAVRAVAEAGFANYDPDACLINQCPRRPTQPPLGREGCLGSHRLRLARLACRILVGWQTPL